MSHKYLIICILQTKWQNFATNLPGGGRHRALVRNLRYTLSNARKGGRNGGPGEGCRKDSRESVRNIMVPSRRTQQNWLPAFFNDFFDDDFRHFGNMMRTSSPAINVKESDKEYTVEIAAPGMSKDDFKIRINEENELVVTLEHKDEKKEEKKDEKYLRREFSYSHFEQTLLLPDDIKKEEISASMEHGVLNITLPKMTEVPATPKERFIDIK